MRFIFGIFVGILLTIGTAYVVDTGKAGDEQAAPRMVNWSVVDAKVRSLSGDIRDGWARLVGDANRIDRKTGI